MELTHASFFSGVGGLDMGLERAGWRTVSFSEIDPYASAVLAEKWPGVPNLGDITDIAKGNRRNGELRERCPNWQHATLWSGGFPCQDLSVAGKRRGMGTHGERADTRSGLAYAFLDLVERYRPPAIILENVPGLLSSNKGRDFYALQRRLAELGYVGAFRVLDAQYFGVPQRRRRVFVVALDARRGLGADSAAEVLSVGSRCPRHPPTGVEAGPGAAERARGGAYELGLSATVSRKWAKGSGGPAGDEVQNLVPAVMAGTSPGQLGYNGKDDFITVVSSSPDPRGVRAADGLAGRAHDRGGVAATFLAPTEGGRRDKIPVTLSPSLGVGPAKPADGGPGDTVPIVVGVAAADSDLLPLGLDSHRYRCCGNGVVSTVPEWFGERLTRLLT